MLRVLIITEQAQGRVAADLLAAAQQVAGGAPCEIFALVVNGDPAALSGWVDRVVSVTEPEIGEGEVRAIADLAAAEHRVFGFACILAPGSQWGSMLAPRLATKLGAALVPEICGIEPAEEGIRFLRPLSRGGDLAVIAVSKGVPAVVTVKPRVFHGAGRPGRATEILEGAGQGVRRGGVRLLGRAERAERDIRDADILISAGGGVGERIDALRPLAEALGGQLSTSRALVNRGVAPRSLQVGQTGKTVAPRLYMAMGIHGASQHVAALEGADSIICVNTNAKAPICSLADIVVVGDAVAFARDLLCKVKEEQENAAD